MSNDPEPAQPSKSRASRDEMDRRRSFFRQFLIDHGEHEIPTSEVVEYLKGKDLPVSERIVLTLAREIKASLPPDQQLWIGRGSFRLEISEESILDQRRREDHGIKRALARAGWYYLVGLGEALEHSAASLFPAHVPGTSTTIVDKLIALDHRSDVTIYMDTGSTIEPFGTQLLGAGHFPLPTVVGGRRVGQRSAHTRYLVPRIISNSQPFSEQVYKLPSRTRTRFEFIKVGGALRPSHGSYCGPLSMMTLKSWEGLGGDISIVGTTGYQLNGPDGTSGFGCDDFFEAQIKAAFTKASWIACIALSSRKLDYPSPRNLFAPLAAHELDLIIVDDGQTTGKAGLVERFVARALNAGVAVLLVKKIPDGDEV